MMILLKYSHPIRQNIKYMHFLVTQFFKKEKKHSFSVPEKFYMKGHFLNT